MATMFGDVQTSSSATTHKIYLNLYDQKLPNAGKIVSKYCNISKTQRGSMTHPPPPFLVPRCGYDCVYVRGLTFFSFTLLELCWYNYCLKVYLQYVYLIIC